MSWYEFDLVTKQGLELKEQNQFFQERHFKEKTPEIFVLAVCIFTVKQVNH